MCLLIESDAVTSSAIYGSVYGLVVITAERYVKIVHPVAHRNHYRRWMTYVGVATPWLIGLLTSSVPSLTSTEFVDGTCRTLVYRRTLVNIYCRLQVIFVHLVHSRHSTRSRSRPPAVSHPHWGHEIP